MTLVRGHDKHAKSLKIRFQSGDAWDMFHHVPPMSVVQPTKRIVEVIVEGATPWWIGITDSVQKERVRSPLI